MAKDVFMFMIKMCDDVCFFIDKCHFECRTMTMKSRLVLHLVKVSKQTQDHEISFFFIFNTIFTNVPTFQPDQYHAPDRSNEKNE